MSDPYAALALSIPAVPASVRGFNLNDRDYQILSLKLLDAVALTYVQAPADNAPSVGNPLYVGGKAVVGSTYAPAYTAGDRAALAIDTVSGGLLTHGRTLTTADQVTAVPGANAATTAATLAQINKTVAATGVPEALVGVSTLVESITIKALKGRTTANTGNVFVGFSATNDTQLHTLAPGEEITLTAPDGKKLELSGIYVDVATNGDGVICSTVN